MFALLSPWFGLLVTVLGLVMISYRPAFNDVTIPIALYGSVLAIGCGGIALMRNPQPGDDQNARDAQRTQAFVGIVLGMVTVMIVWALMSMGQVVVRQEIGT